MNWSKTSSFGLNCAHERLHKVYEIIDTLDTCGTTGAICLTKSLRRTITLQCS